MLMLAIEYKSYIEQGYMNTTSLTVQRLSQWLYFALGNNIRSLVYTIWKLIMDVLFYYLFKAHFQCGIIIELTKSYSRFFLIL